MASKTFKLGEVCRGGVITAEASKGKVTIIAKDWDYSVGSRKSSDQSNAKEWDRLEVFTSSNNAERELNNYLHDLTSSYYAEQVMDWIKSNTIFTQNDW